MSIQTIAVIAALVAIPVAGQLERAPQPDFADAAPDACALSLHGDQPVLTTTIALPRGHEGSIELASTPVGRAFAITPATGGGMPVVQAMAINAKGTGSTNGRSAAPATQSCAVRPSPGPTLTGTMAARAPATRCTISDDGIASVSVPLSAFGDQGAAYRGHVTLMKRGDGIAAITGGAVAGIVVACTAAKASGPRNTGWDLAVAKK